MRRTQEQRRAETRRRLLEATIDSIGEVGYAATTARAVAERAGVSTGAQTHHFPYRLDLIAAAVEYLADQRADALHRAARQMPDTPAERVAAALDLIWADYSSSLFLVMAKLWVAAADDVDLYGCLVPIERKLARSIRSVAQDVMGATSAAPDFDDKITVVLSTIRGLALAERFEPAVAKEARSAWPLHRAVLTKLFMTAMDAGDEGAP